MIKGLSEWQVFLVRFWSVLRWLGCILSLCAFLGSLLRVSVLLVFLSCVHESDTISIDRDLRVALTLVVSPLRRGDCALYKNESALSEVFSQTDMVLSAAAYSYPCAAMSTAINVPCAPVMVLQSLPIRPIV